MSAQGWKSRGKPRARYSLVTYFATASWLIAMILIIASGLIFVKYSTGRTEEQVRATARAIASTVATTMGAQPNLENEAAWRPTVRDAATQPHIAFVRVRHSNGAILSSAGDQSVSTEEVWVEDAPIIHQNATLGRVEVAIYRSAGRELVWQLVLMTVLLTGLATVLTAGVAFGAAYRITNPIRLLLNAAIHWEEPLAEDLRRLTADTAPRELADLTVAFTAMRSRAVAKTTELETEAVQRTRELLAAYTALEESFRQTAAALAQALDARDRYTACHAMRTADLVRRIAILLKLPPDAQRTLVLAANLHDIGKIGVPEHILLKEGPLTSNERLVMQTHPSISATILEPVRGMEEVARLVRHHHERWDGKGYPDHLAGSEIPFGSRIITLADTLEAMCARRPYRDSLSPEAAMAEIRRCSGTQFDPELVEVAWPEIEHAARTWSSAQKAEAT